MFPCLLAITETINMTESHSYSVYRHEFTIPESAVDENGHANNVIYVQWMQDVAVLHSDVSGGTRAMHAAGATWVVRSHQIAYLRPAFAGDEVAALTWVVNFRRVRSLRRYKFLRKGDNRLLAKGETDWVFVDAISGRPRTIPDNVMRAFPCVPEDEEP
jgi:acyl-CoA thioester hydrolase